MPRGRRKGAEGSNDVSSSGTFHLAVYLSICPYHAPQQVCSWLRLRRGTVLVSMLVIKSCAITALDVMLPLLSDRDMASILLSS